MALMFPRVARNFAKNGYFPTDEITLERVLNALTPAESGGMIRVLDPCCGEGVALAEIVHALGRDRVEAYAVEYDEERAEHARTLIEKTLRADLMDCIIERQSVGLLYLNPPYGDLVKLTDGYDYKGSGRRRLEKLFYQQTVHLLQFGGVLVYVIPHYTLDEELAGWITNHFTDVRVYRAPDQRFKQVVIFGVRAKKNDRGETSAEMKAARKKLIEVGDDIMNCEELPIRWPLFAGPYVVPTIQREMKRFYRVSIEPEQFEREIRRIKGLWPEFNLIFGKTSMVARKPLRPLSPWHLALCLAAGAISGPVMSKSGKTFIVKGNTHKARIGKRTFATDDDGNVTETRVLTDTFVPTITAWDMTLDSPTYGCLVEITSTGEPEGQKEATFEVPKDALESIELESFAA